MRLISAGLTRITRKPSSSIVVHRLPVDPGRLHRDLGHLMLLEPIVQRQQLVAGSAEGSNLLADLAAPAVQPDTRAQAGLVHIDPATAPSFPIHCLPPSPRRAGAYSPKEILLCVLEATMWVTHVCPAVKLRRGLAVPLRETTLIAPTPCNHTSFSSMR